MYTLLLPQEDIKIDSENGKFKYSVRYKARRISKTKFHLVIPYHYQYAYNRQEFKTRQIQFDYLIKSIINRRFHFIHLNKIATTVLPNKPLSVAEEMICLVVQNNNRYLLKGCELFKLSSFSCVIIFKIINSSS